jgi:hypothetical protein
MTEKHVLLYSYMLIEVLLLLLLEARWNEVRYEWEKYTNADKDVA